MLKVGDIIRQGNQRLRIVSVIGSRLCVVELDDKGKDGKSQYLSLALLTRKIRQGKVLL